MDIIKLEKVSKIYGMGDSKVVALREVDLNIKKGSRVSIIGPSGSGKSTLLHIIGGVNSPSRGSVVVDNTDITKLKDEELAVYRRRKLGFVFQAYHLIPVLSVEENINMGILLDHKKPNKGYIEEIMNMLGIWEKRKVLPNQLSGGQQQRVAIARALANQPSIILADEPTGSLDTKNGHEVMNLLNESAIKYSQTLVLITHNIDLARETDRIIKIEDGQIVADD